MVKKYLFRIYVLVVMMLVTSLSTSFAQELCEVLVRDIWEKVKDNCQTTNNLSACYGYDSLVSTFQVEMTPDLFQEEGDQVDLSVMNSIRTMPFDEEVEEWGVTYFRMGADLFGGDKQDNVVIFMTGDVIVENMIAVDGTIPVQDFNFKTASKSSCKDAPNAVFIQSPKGITVDLVINSTPIQIGSTVVLQTQKDENGVEQMSIAVLEGNVTVFPGENYEVAMTQGEVLLSKLTNEGEIALDFLTGEPMLGPDGEPFYRASLQEYLLWTDITSDGEDIFNWDAYRFALFIPQELLNYSLAPSYPQELLTQVDAIPSSSGEVPQRLANDQGEPLLDTDAIATPTDVPDTTTNDSVVPDPIEPPLDESALSDRDGDGVPDTIDSCPDQGDAGNGIDASGCPIPAEEPMQQQQQLPVLPDLGDGG